MCPATNFPTIDAREPPSPDANLDMRSCNLPRGTNPPRGGLKSNNLGKRKNNFHPRVSTVLLFAADPRWISCKLNFMAPRCATQALTWNTSAKSTSSKLAVGGARDLIPSSNRSNSLDRSASNAATRFPHLATNCWHCSNCTPTGMPSTATFAFFRASWIAFTSGVSSTPYVCRAASNYKPAELWKRPRLAIDEHGPAELAWSDETVAYELKAAAACAADVAPLSPQLKSYIQIRPSPADHHNSTYNEITMLFFRVNKKNFKQNGSKKQISDLKSISSKDEILRNQRLQ